MLKQPALYPVPDQNQYELIRDYTIHIEDTEIVVPKHFRYDGASIPAPAWKYTYTPFHPDVMVPSLVHDWLFFNHQVDRELTDEIFYRMLRNNGVNYLLSNTMWAAVRAGGGLFWDNDDEDIDIMARLCKKVCKRPNFERYQFPQAVRERCGC